MTLLVGILCPEGVAIATDRQVTLGTMGTATVAQAGTKAQIIRKGHAIYASSGAVGIGQQICDGIDKLSFRFDTRVCVSAVPEIAKAARAVIEPAFQVAQKAVGVIGHPATQQDVLCGGVLAGSFSDGIKLIEMNVQGGCEILTLESVPFVCLGSGKANADPFLRFLWDIYWKENRPTLKEAVLAGYWTVRVVTQLRTQGVGCGVEVFTLRNSGKGPIAEKIQESALDEHNDFIVAAEDAMRGVREGMQGRSDGAGADSTTPPALPGGPTAEIVRVTGETVRGAGS